jgi:hypothetical protein
MLFSLLAGGCLLLTSAFAIARDQRGSPAKPVRLKPVFSSGSAATAKTEAAAPAPKLRRSVLRLSGLALAGMNGAAAKEEEMEAEAAIGEAVAAPARQEHAQIPRSI